MRVNFGFGSVPTKTRAFNNGNGKGPREKVVLIDLDDDSVVIIDDVAEPSQKNFGKSSVDNVIHIDDDDETVGPEANGELDSDANSSKSRFPTFKTMGGSVQTDADGWQSVKGKTSAFQFSKCKQTYRTKPPPAGSRFGLHSSFNNTPTNDDSSDCEIVVDSYGEEWKRASLKRKHVDLNQRSGLGNQSSSSESNNVSGTHAAEEIRKEQHPISGNAGNMRGRGYEFVATNGETSSANAEQTSEKKRRSIPENESFKRNKNSEPGGSSVSGHTRHYNESRQSKDKETTPQDGHFYYEYENYQNDCSIASGFWKEAPRPHWFPVVEESGVPNSAHPSAVSKEKEKIDPGRMFVPNSRVFDDGQVDNGVPVTGESSGGGLEDILSRCSSSEGKPGESSGKACHQDESRADGVGGDVRGSSGGRPSCSLNEGRKEPNGSRVGGEPNVIPSVENCIITDREKLKDTDEFKQAIEEEWAARQRELKIQAEEAQRLRKRKKAETMRLCDIERRQKQRVEEVRQTQKKNAEDINLKEKFRGEIKKEITKLEITCFNMASLLRGLGITVNSDDVNAAYKQALLKFHPDRASRMDMRQQVEAEEKFKLISRMKEKFLTSCC